MTDDSRENIIPYHIIFGWWGIPWGPIHTVKSISVNNKGGIDVTNDIMLNLTESNLKEREIELCQINEIYCKPDRWEIKALNKAFQKLFDRDANVLILVAGVFVNTEKNENPYLIIGLEVSNNIEKYVEIVDKAFYKQFQKYIRYDLLDLSNNQDDKKQLLKLGHTIKNKSNTTP